MIGQPSHVSLAGGARERPRAERHHNAEPPTIHIAACRRRGTDIGDEPPKHPADRQHESKVETGRRSRWGHQRGRSPRLDDPVAGQLFPKSEPRFRHEKDKAGAARASHCAYGARGRYEPKSRKFCPSWLKIRRLDPGAPAGISGIARIATLLLIDLRFVAPLLEATRRCPPLAPLMAMSVVKCRRAHMHLEGAAISHRTGDEGFFGSICTRFSSARNSARSAAMS